MSTAHDNPATTSNRRRTLLIRAVKLLGAALPIILAVAALLGLVPVSTDSFESEPEPANSYAEALRRFDEIQAKERGITNELTRSKLLTHRDKTDRAFVLVHGTTNSPRQFQELGEILHERGHNVLILRMPYHGLESLYVGELKRLKAGDLSGYADRAIDIAAGLGDRVVVIGLSGGGAVAAWMAQNRPDVERAVILAPFFGIAGMPSFVDTFLMNLFVRLPNVDFYNPGEPGRDWGYRGEASRGVAEFMRFGKGIFRQANAPGPAARDVFLVTTASDDTADNRYAEKLAEIWRAAGTNVTTYEFDASLGVPHNSIDLTTDPDKKAIVYAKILELLGEAPLR
jgi:esterase/lipase